MPGPGSRRALIFSYFLFPKWAPLSREPYTYTRMLLNGKMIKCLVNRSCVDQSIPLSMPLSRTACLLPRRWLSMVSHLSGYLWLFRHQACLPVFFLSVFLHLSFSFSLFLKLSIIRYFFSKTTFCKPFILQILDTRIWKPPTLGKFCVTVRVQHLYPWIKSPSKSEERLGYFQRCPGTCYLVAGPTWHMFCAFFFFPLLCRISDKSNLREKFILAHGSRL